MKKNKNNLVYYWDFNYNQPVLSPKPKFINYLIGNRHKTPKNCINWYKKYGFIFKKLEAIQVVLKKVYAK